MSGPASPPPRRALVHLGIALLLIGLVEALVSLLPSPPAPIDWGSRMYPTSRVPTIDESLIQWQVDRLVRTPADVLLFGDSSALMGLDPAVFESETGLSAQNYGTVRWLGATGHADLLELYIERHGPPRVAIYHMGTGLHSLGARRIATVRSNRGELLRAFREWTGRPIEYPVPLPSLGLRPLAMAMVDGRTYSDRYTHAPRAYGLSDAERAAFLAEHQGMSVDLNPVPPDAWGGVPAPPVRFDPAIEPGFVRMFEAAQRHGFPLLLAHNPIPSQFQDAERTAAYGLVERRFVAIAEPYPLVRVVGPFARHAPNAAFANYEHLNPRGAAHNSRQLAALVLQTLGSGRAPMP